MKLSPFLALLATMASPVSAANLYARGNWSALASDRRAERVGDGVTIIVSTTSQASNLVRKGSKKRTSIDGQIVAGKAFDNSAGLNFGGTYDGQGENVRTDKMIAQLSATVDEVLPNGDLRVSGWQRLKINGELTSIRVSGRVRRDDISNDNTILSSRLADAVIDYDGKGFATSSAKPGVVAKIFNWLGIL